MTITQPLVLPGDLRIFPVAELPEDSRRDLPHAPGDFALTRPRSRVPSKIVDSHAAELLEGFREPSTVGGAVLRFSRERGLDPERTLEESFPLLMDLIGSGLLLPADSEQAAPIEPLLSPGAVVGGFEVRECINLAQDTEVYRAAGPAGGAAAAMKIARPGCGPAVGAMILREAGLLAHLDGRGAPRALCSGVERDRPYLVSEWVAGSPVLAAAAEHRRRGDPEGRAALANLCEGTIGAFAAVHAAGVVHGDVHPMNVLAERDGRVVLVDFGLGRMADEPAGPGTARGGVAFYFEPEYAEALLAGRPAPAAGAAGEQHAVAALVYQMLTGSHYADFSLQQERLLTQIAQGAPLSFESREARGWDRTERELRRALSKDAADRFASMGEFAGAFAGAARADLGDLAGPGGPRGPVPARAPGAAARALLERTLSDLSPDGALFAGPLEAPSASIKHGSAGVALGLLAIAGARRDPALLAAADLWAARTGRGLDLPGAFLSPEKEVTREVIGEVAPLHTLTGLHCVRALIGHAMGDTGARDRAVASFVRSSTAPCEALDITLGRLSTVIGCGMLLGMLSAEDEAREALAALGTACLDEAWDKLDGFPAIEECPRVEYPGIAHGWAGFIYAALLWSRLSGRDLRDGVHRRLDELAALAEPAGRGTRWPWAMRPRAPGGEGGAAGRSGSMPGWCNGAAGMVFLWSLAHRRLGDRRSLDLAVRSGFAAWEAGGPVTSLCCGMAGQSYAMLNLHRLTGERVWLARARDLAIDACAVEAPPDVAAHSLYKGTLGLAVLLAELEHPEHARMPFFEPAFDTAGAAGG